MDELFPQTCGGGVFGPMRRLVMVAKGSVSDMRALAERCGQEGIEVSLRRCSGRS